ncbi:MAG: AMP-binding protein [Pseudomonadota bacterium]
MSLIERPVSFGSAATLLADGNPEGLALVCDGPQDLTTVSWLALEQRANRLARALMSEGVVAGDFVTLALPNGVDYFCTCLALWKLGAVPNPVSHRLPVIERDGIIDRADPRLVVADTALDIPGRRSVTPAIADAIANSEPLPEVVSPYERAMASGGSTGLPKLIVASNEARYDPDSASPLFRGKRAVLVPGPLYHGAPFSAAWQGLFAGCTVVVMHRFDALRMLQLIESYQVDRMTVVPTMMQRVWRLPQAQRESYDVSSLEFVLTGSAPCPPWLMRAWIEWLGADVMHEAFGPSERLGGTFITGREWLQHPGSVGKPAAGARMRILGEDGVELPPGEMGEIYIMPAQGPGSTSFYVGAEPKLTPDGWQSVGDMGYMDDDGYVYLGDRRSDLVLVGGRNVYPAEVEAAIDAFHGVRSCAVIGLPDDDLGERLHAIVDVGEEAVTLNEEKLRAHLEQRLVHYKVPLSFELVTTLLRDDAGKLRRSALRRERLDGTLGADGHS